MQPATFASLTTAQIASYNAPTLLTPGTSPVPTGDLLKSWMATRQRHRSAITLLCGPFYAPFIYGEHRYASTFQAAEALARDALDTSDRQPTAHRARLAAVTGTLEQAGLDRADIDWAIRILKGRNDKSLPALLDELAASTGELGEQILAQVPNFGKRVADARVGVSHPIARGVGSLPLHWLGEVLSWIVRVRLLTSANVPLDYLAAKAARKPRLGQALHAIASPSPP